MSGNRSRRPALRSWREAGTVRGRNLPLRSFPARGQRRRQPPPPWFSSNQRPAPGALQSLWRSAGLVLTPLSASSATRALNSESCLLCFAFIGCVVRFGLQPLPTHYNHSLAPGPNSGVRLSQNWSLRTVKGLPPPECGRRERSRRASPPSAPASSRLSRLRQRSRHRCGSRNRHR